MTLLDKWNDQKSNLTKTIFWCCWII